MFPRIRRLSPNNPHYFILSAIIPTMTSFLSDIQARIEAFPGSYRFLYGAAETLDSDYYFVGLNPGGTVDDPSDVAVREGGNAFVDEKWASGGDSYNTLQKQVHWFFENLGASAGVADWRAWMSKSWMISNYVFYRSGRWTEMAKKREHIANCRGIWRTLFSHRVPRVIVCNGYDVYKQMKGMLGEFGWATATETLSERSWDGPHTSVMSLDGASCMLVGFAHLSTYKIMGRAANEAALTGVFTAIRGHIVTPAP
jgi:hypothetical protein